MTTLTDVKRIAAILGPTDPEGVGTERAIARAAALARGFGADLVILLAADCNDYLEGCRRLDPASLQQAEAEFIASKRAWLKEIAKAATDAGVRTTSDIIVDRPWYEGIVRAVLDARADLVVKATRYHSLVERATFSSTDWRLVEQCPVPLLLVRTDAWPESPKVLAAVDPGDERDASASLDHAILDAAEACARAVGGTVYVLHVYASLESLGALAGAHPPVALPPGEIDERLAGVHGEALAALVAGRNLSDEQVLLREGHPRDEIEQAVKTLPASLIVMGAVARSALQRIFVGSTAEKLLHRLTCDVLIVKAPGFQTTVPR